MLAHQAVRSGKSQSHAPLGGSPPKGFSPSRAQAGKCVSKNSSVFSPKRWQNHLEFQAISHEPRPKHGVDNGRVLTSSSHWSRFHANSFQETPMTTGRRFLFILSSILFGSPGLLAGEQATVKKYALLVGCSEYQNDILYGFNPLPGAANDVELWAQFLTDRIGLAFPPSNIIRLAGWPDQPALQPTYQNIVAGFADLAEKARPNDQVVIVLSGHGTQFPIPSGKNKAMQPGFEPDGLSEIFLPADYISKTDQHDVKNFLSDLEISGWLEKIRARQAHVFVVFDCCYAGNMAHNAFATVRSVNPLRLGYTEKDIQESVSRAASEVEAAKVMGVDATAQAKIKPSTGKNGSLVAFYASQSFERAVELDLPMDAVDKRKHGLLSYTLVQTLLQRKAPITYRDLVHIAGARFRVTPIGTKPAPYAEGDLDRPLLGISDNSWPLHGPNVILSRDRGSLRINAGYLHGVTLGSVLAVNAPDGPGPMIRGYVRVISAAAESATVAACGFNGAPEVSSTKLADNSRCELVAKDYGDMRLKLFTPDENIKRVLDSMDVRIRNMIRPVEFEFEATYSLIPEGQTVIFRHAFLTAGNENAAYTAAAAKPAITEELGRYPMAQLKSGLELDLPKVVKWQNTWRVAGEIVSECGRVPNGLTVETVRDGKQLIENDPVSTLPITTQTTLQIRLKNDSQQDIWVSTFYLSRDRAIEKINGPNSVMGGTMRTDRLTVSLHPKFTGREGLMVLAFPKNEIRDPPDCSILIQSRFGADDVGRQDNSSTVPEKSPFLKLIRQAVFPGVGRVTGAPLEPVSLRVATQSWFVGIQPK